MLVLGTRHLSWCGMCLDAAVVVLADGTAPIRQMRGPAARRRTSTTSPGAITELSGDAYQDGVLGTPWHEERALPALCALFELPFEHMIVAHGGRVHDRACHERAVEVPPYGGARDQVSD